MNDTAAPILYLVSGLSGSGKSVALRTFEDLGFYCVDNLPAGMLADFVANVTRADEPPGRLAVGIDVRNRHTDLSRVPTWLSDDDSVSLLFESFAYRRGVPADADFVFDARALPNPHWDPRMRPLSGRDVDVRTWFEGHPEVGDYSAQVAQFLDTWLPRMRSATRSYVTVAFGCSGGRHRSVYLAERLARHLVDGNAD